MRIRLISTLCFLLSSGILYAQAIPNAGLENWSFLGWFENPTGWYTNNMQIIAPVVPDSQAYQGNLAMRVGPYGYAGVGFPYASDNVEISCYSRVEMGASDTVSLTVTAYSNGMIVLLSNMQIDSAIPNWTRLSLFLNTGASSFDSLDIRVTGGRQSGTYFIVDQFENVSLTTAQPSARVENFRIWPNPAADRFWIATDGLRGGGCHVTVYDGSGRCVKALNGNCGETMEIGTEGLPGGLYIVELQISGRPVQKGRLMVR